MHLSGCPANRDETAGRIPKGEPNLRIGRLESPTHDDGAAILHFEISRNNDPSMLSRLSRANSSPTVKGKLTLVVHGKPRPSFKPCHRGKAHRIRDGRLEPKSTKGPAVGKERLRHPARDAIKLDGVLSALSDPIRRDILRKIASNGPQVCGDFDYDVAPSTMSYHCKVLRESGLVHTEAIGKHRQLTRRDEAIEALFPGLLESVGLPPGQGRWPEDAGRQEGAEP